MAYDERALAMRDSTAALLNFPSRLAVVSPLRGSSVNDSAVADEVNARVLESRQRQQQQQQHQNSLHAYAQRASQTAINGSEYSLFAGQNFAGKRPREQEAALLAVVTPEAGHQPKVPRIGIEQELQSGLQPHPQQQAYPGQEQHGVEQEEQQMEFMAITEDMEMDVSEELISSSSAAEVDREVAPLRPEIGIAREIYFADFF